MALKIDIKLKGKLTCAFETSVKNLANLHRLKSSDLILESKMMELNQNKKPKKIRSIRCSLKTPFYLVNK